MIPNSLFSVNCYEKEALPMARGLGFGLEVEEYLWTYTADEIKARQAYVPGMMAGFSKFTFHGTGISRDVEAINRLSEDELLALYDESCGYAAFHGIFEVVFHSNYLAGMWARDAWLEWHSAFWRRFLADKGADFCVYLENFIDDTPGLLAELHDRVEDDRFKICLDTGHACCNAAEIPLGEWIRRLGKRIRHVHLHNNDTVSDKHWALGRGALDMAVVLDDLMAYADVKTFVLECAVADSVDWLRGNGFISG